MNNNFIRSLPEQVAQNTLDIEVLKKITQPSACDIDLSNNTTSVSARHITPTIDKGFIIDFNGNLYKILSYDEDNLLYNVQFLCDISTEGPQGPIGPAGNGIVSITLTGTVGLVDTYTITYTNGTTSTFTVTNGDEGPEGPEGPTGPAGRGISTIAKTGTSGNVDTYTITYTDGTTSTYTVTNGSGALVTNTVSTVNDIINYVRFNYDKTLKVRLNLNNTGISATTHKFNMSTQTYTAGVETVYPGNPILTLVSVTNSGIKFIASGMYTDPVVYYLSNGHIYMQKTGFYYNDVVTYYEEIDITSLFTSADIIYFS